MWAMLEYKQAQEVTPYEPVWKRIGRDVEEEWYKAKYLDTAQYHYCKKQA